MTGAKDVRAYKSRCPDCKASQSTASLNVYRKPTLIWRTACRQADPIACLFLLPASQQDAIMDHCQDQPKLRYSTKFEQLQACRKHILQSSYIRRSNMPRPKIAPSCTVGDGILQANVRNSKLKGGWPCTPTISTVAWGRHRRQRLSPAIMTCFQEANAGICSLHVVGIVDFGQVVQASLSTTLARGRHGAKCHKAEAPHVSRQPAQWPR